MPVFEPVALTRGWEALCSLHQLSESVLQPWVDSALLEAYGLRMGKESYPKGTLRTKYGKKNLRPSLVSPFLSN